MHKKDMVDAMLGKIEQAIIRILNNSQSIDSYHYYLITPANSAIPSTHQNKVSQWLLNEAWQTHHP